MGRTLKTTHISHEPGKHFHAQSDQLLLHETIIRIIRAHSQMIVGINDVKVAGALFLDQRSFNICVEPVLNRYPAPLLRLRQRFEGVQLQYIAIYTTLIKDAFVFRLAIPASTYCRV